MSFHVVLWISLSAFALGAQDYMELVDPWLSKKVRPVQAAEGVLMLELHKGVLKAFTADGSPYPLEGEQYEGTMQAIRSGGVFPEEIWQPAVSDEVWLARQRSYVGLDHDGHVLRKVDDDCPVNAENHFEKTIVEVFDAVLLKLWAKSAGGGDSSGYGKMLNIGGLYGGRNGEGENAPDDPTVELLRAQPHFHVLCWNCGDVSEITRVGDLANRFEHADVDLLSSDLSAPAEFRKVDLLRMDQMPAGQSCRVLEKLLKSGLRPRLVAMLVFSQVPPPFKFAPLSLNTERHPEVLLSCSLAFASSLLESYGLALLRLTGPYALFIQKDLWRQPLPLDELACYRGASVWGYEDLPMSFVREWLFSHPDASLPHVWNNISAIYAASGQINAPFSLAFG